MAKKTLYAILVLVLAAGALLAGYFLGTRTQHGGSQAQDHQESPLSKQFDKHRMFGMNYGDVYTYTSADGKREAIRVYAVTISDSNCVYDLEHTLADGGTKYERMYLQPDGLCVLHGDGSPEYIEHRLKLPIKVGDSWSTFFPGWGEQHIEYTCKDSEDVEIEGVRFMSLVISAELRQRFDPPLKIQYWYSVDHGLLRYSRGNGIFTRTMVNGTRQTDDGG